MLLYIFLFVFVVVGSAVSQEHEEKERSDVIWFPTDDSEDRFVSSYGEKWRYLVPEWNNVKSTRERREGRSRDGERETAEAARFGFFGNFNFRPQGIREVPETWRRPFKQNDVDPYFDFKDPSQFQTQFAVQTTTTTRPIRRTTLKPMRRTTRKPTRRTTSDSIMFEQETTTSRITTTPTTQPTTTTTMSMCERVCPVTPEFNPVCGSDDVNYSNPGRFKCAKKCGKNIEMVHHGNCGQRSGR